MMIKRNRGRNTLDWQRRASTAMKVAGLAAGVLLLGSLLVGEMGMPRYLSMRQHAQQLEQEIQTLQRTNAVLHHDVDRIQHDPVTIEELARERLGLVRKGDTVYQFVPDSENNKRSK
ncbi:MAG: FtsB family cell division protein [Nitrospiraceae bacterium]